MIIAAERALQAGELAGPVDRGRIQLLGGAGRRKSGLDLTRLNAAAHILVIWISSVPVRACAISDCA